ncbi:MAG: heavy metal translocating P-type ATPase metal-binding domain-containing protein [Deltaproteobacteria bacterium]
MAITTVSRDSAHKSKPESARCLHCGEELDSSNTVVSESGNFCCRGCMSVYELLHTLGLDNYYKIKDAQDIGKTGAPIDTESTENYEYLNQKSFIELYTAAESPLSMNFYVEGIECAACLWLIEKIPDYTPEIESVSLDMSDNTATVNFTPERNFSSFPVIAKKFGYRAHPVRIDEEARELKRRENRKSLIRLSVAAVCAGNIMLLSAAVYSGAGGVFAENFMLLNLLLSLPVVTYCAYPFYKSVLSSLRMKRATVDIPIVFVIVIGFVLSAYNYFNGSDQIYFDSITAFVLLLLGSRYLLKTVQDRVVRKEPVSRSLFSSNRVLIWDDKARQFFYQPVENLRPGQRIKLHKGERVPADGELLSRNADLNLSVLTGENIPETVRRKDSVFAGSILESDEAVLKVAKTGKSTRIGKILDQVESNYRGKIGLSTYSDKYSTVFTLIVGIAAVATFFTISYLYNTSEALERVIAFTLISCPCAFVFALPLSYGLSLKSGMAKGFLIKDAGNFEKLPSVEKIFFDKTGTLTNGVFKILKWNSGELSEKDYAAILAIEKKSNHPIARTLTAHLKDNNYPLPEVRDFRHIYSEGIEAVADGHHYRLTSENSVIGQNDLNEIITTKIVVHKDGKPVSEIVLGDTLKEDAKFVINELVVRGYKVFILSGDKENNVKHVADKLQIPYSQAYWEEIPEGKSRIISENRNSLMIGDGLNDAGALSSSDVSVAIQGSVEESLKVSDAYILNNDLFTILDLIDHGNATGETIRRNTVFSIIYNVAAGGFALTGFITPLAAAVLMPLSSLLLIGSTLYGQTILDTKRKVAKT